MKKRLDVVAETIVLGVIEKENNTVSGFVKVGRQPKSIKSLKSHITSVANAKRRGYHCYDEYSHIDIVLMNRTFFCSDGTFETDTRVLNYKVFAQMYTESKQLGLKKMDLFDISETDIFKKAVSDANKEEKNKAETETNS